MSGPGPGLGQIRTIKSRRMEEAELIESMGEVGTVDASVGGKGVREVKLIDELIVNQNEEEGKEPW